MRYHLFIGLLGGAALLSGAVFWFWPEAASLPLPSPLSASAPVGQQQELDRLRRSVDRLSAEQGKLALAQDSLAQDLEAREERGEPAPLRTGPGSVDPAQAQDALLTELIDGEAEDPAWAPGASRALGQSFTAAAIPGATLVEATCRSSLCRVEVELPGGGPELVATLHGLAPWPANAFSTIELGDGEEGAPTVAVVWFSREGASLPRAG